MTWQIHIRALVACASLVHGAEAYDFAAAGRNFGFVYSFHNDGQDSNVLGFGMNDYGQLGINTTENALAPTPVLLPNETIFVQVAAGAFHSLFLGLDFSVWASGWNRWGQFGDDTPLGDMVMVPKQVYTFQAYTGAKRVAVGYGHSLILLTNGTVLAAGYNSQGQLADGTTTSSSVFKTVWDGEHVQEVAAGYDFSYFLTLSGEVYAVGQNLGGQLGDGTRMSRLSPVKTMISAAVRSIAAGAVHGLFLLKETNQVYGTGANYVGQLGDVWIPHGTDTPRQIRDMGTERVSAGGDGSCMIETSVELLPQELLCMGNNQDGQLGLGATKFATTPTRAFAWDAKRVAIGETHSLLITAEGELRSSGTGDSGELGTGTTDPSTDFGIPVRLDTTRTTTTATTSTTTTVSATSTTLTASRRGTQDNGDPSASSDGITPGTIFLIATGLGVVVLGGTLIARPRATDSEETDDQNDFGEMQLARAAQTSV